MTQLRTRSSRVPQDLDPARARWPLALAAAGLLGLAAVVSRGLDGTGAQQVANALTLASAGLLVVAAASWRRLVEPRARASTAVHVVPLALLASAAASALSPGAGLGVWWGVMGAAAAVAWMALRERSVSRPVGALSALAVIIVPVTPAVAAPVWLLVTGLGLAFGRSTIAR